MSGADRYDVARGSLGELDGESYGACLAEDLTERRLEDTDTPLPGEGFFYLVRGDDAICGSGPLGPSSAAPERTNGHPQACLLSPPDRQRRAD